MPELAQWKTLTDGTNWCMDAVLDVPVTGGFELQDDYWDVTVRHPGSKHVAERAAEVDGVAAEEGARDKLKRYPPTRGKKSAPLLWKWEGEWGRRPSVCGRISLAKLRGETGRAAIQRGGGSSDGRQLSVRRWPREWRPPCKRHSQVSQGDL